MREESDELDQTPAIPSSEGDAEPTNPSSTKGKQHRDLSLTVLDNIYKLESKVNGGGMGEIWKARHIGLDTEWLVKLLPAEFSQDTAYIDALLREAKITAKLPGGYFPSVVHTGISDGIAFYVMESITGQDLGRLLEGDEYPQGMSCAEALPLLVQILEAMSVAHREGVIHRDLKPDNIFVETVAGKESRIRILDFGVSKVKDEVYATISKKLPRGTQQYMPPELHRPIPAAASAAGDVFAIGLTAYQMILGRHPFAATDHVLRYEQGKELGPLHEDRDGKRAGVNADVAGVLATAVRFNPEERFADASSMLRALKYANEFRPRFISAGTVLANSYRVLGKLGEGGMGAVYDVEDIHRPVEGKQVLKILAFPPGCSERAQASLRERFRRECDSLHSLQHESIPYIYGNASHLDYPFLVMERAQGETFGKAFHRLLAKGGWDAVFSMARQVASALDAVHQAGIIHRDIKPSNIVIDPETAKAVVLDFGIARLQGTQLTGDGARIGTPGFSAPEQIMGTPVAASDQWSFAACFYALLTNIRPGTLLGEDKKIAPDELAKIADERILGGEVGPFSEQKALVDVPRSIVTAIGRAMSHHVDDRYPTLGAFVESMGEGISAPFEPVTSKVPSEDTHNRWLEDEEDVDDLIASQSDSRIVVTPTEPGEAFASTPSASTLAEPPRVHSRRYVPVLALLAVFAGGGYVAWEGRATNDRAKPPRPEEAAARFKTVAAEPVFAAAASPPKRDAGKAVRLVTVEVSAFYKGQQMEGIPIRIANQTNHSPFTAEMPLGETIANIDEGKYSGEYKCNVSLDSALCKLELVRRLKEKRKLQKDSGFEGDGVTEDLLHVFKSKGH